LVIFTSDNGPWLEWGEHGGSAAPFRGGIGTTLEGGVRVPCLMRWPGVIPAASTCRAVASIMDFLPTFAKLAGGDPPQDRVLDGHDIGPLLRDPTTPSPREFLLHYNGTQLQAVRSGYWKLHVPHRVRTASKPLPKPGEYSQAEQVPIELSLFDLRNDLGENVNLAAYYPDVVKRLQQYIAWGREDIGDSLTDSVGQNARPAGRRT
jgi:arylsulfatase A-like enzyme